MKRIFFLLAVICSTLNINAQDLIINGLGKEGTATFFDKRKDIDPSLFKCVTTSDGKDAFEVEVKTQSKTAYDAELKVCSSGKVSKGDVCLAKVTLRAVYARQETGECAAHLYFQRAVSPWEKSVATQLAAGSEWKTIYIPFIAKNTFEPGEAAISIAFGSLRQKVQVSEISVTNYHNTKTLSELPVTKLTYAGREADAQWRKDALARIDSLRTSMLTVRVVDQNGKPAVGANVNISLNKSSFIWGTAVNEEMLGGENPESDRYKKQLLEFFNTAVIENGFKSGSWYWEDSRKQNTVRAFKWLQDNNMRQRGHNLIWPGWKFNPRNYRLIAQQDTAAFHRLILAHLHERMAYTKGKFIHWDVINEIMHEKDFDAILPANWPVEVFKLAKQLDPNAKLFINDYAMLNGSHSPLVIKEYIDWIKQMRQQGAPIEGAGVQGHVGTQPRSPIQVLSDLDLFKNEDITIDITEFDINTDDEELQADYTRDFLIAAYSHPSVEGITLWGFWEKKHWKPLAAMFRKDWSERPAANEWRNLVCKEWKTNVTNLTDKTGTTSAKAHLGEYDVTVTYKGITRHTTCTLHKEGNELLVQMTPDVVFDKSYNCVGKLQHKTVKEADSDLLTVGCETLDRDYTDYDAYKTYLPELGIKNLRMQAGWAKTEKVKGVYDFSWLDHIVDNALANGHRIWMQTSYGNPIYTGGGNANLGGGMPTSAEAKEAWNRWVRAMAEHFRGRITDWEIWNEPDLSEQIPAQDIVELNIRTARILKSVDPNCRIAGLAFCVLNTELLTECMDLIKKENALDLFDWVSYHGYSYNPDESYENVVKFRQIIDTYRPAIKLRQGENGAPSQGFKGGALDKYNWTELSQAKWDLRRLSGDHCHGVEASVFSIIDMAYPNGENKYVATLNVKGLLQADPLKRVVRKKIAFGAVQNYVAVFPLLNSIQPAGTARFVSSAKHIRTHAFTSKKGALSVLYWNGKENPLNSNTVRQNTIKIKGTISNPAIADILTGKIYTVPAQNITVINGMTTISNLPVYDSPILLTSTDNLNQ